jgi:hypothetical protein
VDTTPILLKAVAAAVLSSGVAVAGIGLALGGAQAQPGLCCRRMAPRQKTGQYHRARAARTPVARKIKKPGFIHRPVADVRGRKFTGT